MNCDIETPSIWRRIYQLPCNLIPSYARLPLLVTVLWNAIVYYGSRLIAQNWHHHMMELPIDQQIPFIPWTVAIYYASFLFWIINYILCVRQEKKWAYQFLSADFWAKGICLLCFLLFPTTNIRPVVDPQGFWNAAIQFLYRSDAADNLFPSIHCLTSWFCYIGLQKQQNIPVWYRRLSSLIALAVFLSTLTTKQHVAVDVVGGILLAQFSYWFTGHTFFAEVYGRLFDHLIQWRTDHNVSV